MTVGRPYRVPSRLHEERRALLGTIADLAGYGLEAVLPDGCRPDVLRWAGRGRGLFIGEAKATEGPTDDRSMARLSHYVGWLQALEGVGVPGVLAIAHRVGSDAAWRCALTSLTAERTSWSSPRSRRVNPETTVTATVYALIAPWDTG